MFRNMKNDLSFFAFREEGNVTFAAFSYSERNGLFHDAYGHIIEILNDVFQIKAIKVQPYEITMLECLEYLLEAKRRGYVNIFTGIIEASNLWIYYYYNEHQPKPFHYDFLEHIISEKGRKNKLIYDQKFVNLYCRENGVKEVSRGGSYHNGRFKAEAEKRGLECFKCGQYGWNTRPSDKLIEYALSKNWNEIRIGRNTALPMIRTGGNGATQIGASTVSGGTRPSSTRKLICPCCKQSVRATKTVNVLCGDCMVKMEEV